MSSNRLKEIREKRNISQNRLSKISGVSQQQISRYEKNQPLSEDSIKKICEALECNADYLLGLIDEDVQPVMSGWNPISFKEYYLDWYGEILEIDGELEKYPKEVTILFDIVSKKQFLLSNSYSENLYMVKVFIQNTQIDEWELENKFAQVWEGYEENCKFPFRIKSVNYKRGILIITLTPKIDLKRIDLYVKLKTVGSERAYLFDVSLENSTYFHAHSDYQTHLIYDEYYEISDFVGTFASKVIEYLSKEEFDRSEGIVHKKENDYI